MKNRYTKIWSFVSTHGSLGLIACTDIGLARLVLELEGYLRSSILRVLSLFFKSVDIVLMHVSKKIYCVRAKKDFCFNRDFVFMMNTTVEKGFKPWLQAPLFA
ncbi:hypothetical protein EDC96DRAFT_543249 [Choanephora cucurbitarum]|nr:hypothetical protein EDC96DRAFT_543249 [Choanephora cucurbitarum]